MLFDDEIHNIFKGLVGLISNGSSAVVLTLELELEQRSLASEK